MCACHAYSSTIVQVHGKDIPLALAAWSLLSASVALVLTHSPALSIGISILCVSVLLLNRISGIYAVSCSKCLGSNRKVKRRYESPIVSQNAQKSERQDGKMTLGWSVTYNSTIECSSCNSVARDVQTAFISREQAITHLAAIEYATDKRELLIKN
jgi:hypothetical protein